MDWILPLLAVFVQEVARRGGRVLLEFADDSGAHCFDFVDEDPSAQFAFGGHTRDVVLGTAATAEGRRTTGAFELPEYFAPRVDGTTIQSRRHGIERRQEHEMYACFPAPNFLEVLRQPLHHLGFAGPW